MRRSGSYSSDASESPPSEKKKWATDRRYSTSQSIPRSDGLSHSFQVRRRNSMVVQPTAKASRRSSMGSPVAGLVCGMVQGNARRSSLSYWTTDIQNARDSPPVTPNRHKPDSNPYGKAADLNGFLGWGSSARRSSSSISRASTVSNSSFTLGRSDSRGSMSLNSQVPGRERTLHRYERSNSNSSMHQRNSPSNADELVWLAAGADSVATCNESTTRLFALPGSRSESPSNSRLWRSKDLDWFSNENFLDVSTCGSLDSSGSGCGNKRSPPESIDFSPTSSNRSVEMTKEREIAMSIRRCGIFSGNSPTSSNRSVEMTEEREIAMSIRQRGIFSAHDSSFQAIIRVGFIMLFALLFCCKLYHSVVLSPRPHVSSPLPRASPIGGDCAACFAAVQAGVEAKAGEQLASNCERCLQAMEAVVSKASRGSTRGGAPSFKPAVKAEPLASASVLESEMRIVSELKPDAVEMIRQFMQRSEKELMERYAERLSMAGAA